MDLIRSHDGGATWTPPSVVADSDQDDRNPAFGTSPAGTLLLSYMRQPNYDEQGFYHRDDDPQPEREAEIRVTRSTDGGLSWEPPVLLEDKRLRPGSPYGKIVTTRDGTLLMAIYGPAVTDLIGDGGNSVQVATSYSYLIRSRDDGRTWENPSLIGVNMNETALLPLDGGDLLAVMRGEGSGDALYSTHSSDGGFTWSEPRQITGPRQHPADLLLLTNGAVLLTYGNRNPPYRIEGRISRDGGRTWLATVLAFSGHLYGYNVEQPRTTDLGYPSNARVGGVDAGQIVTMYYYSPAIPLAANWRQREGSYLYAPAGYRAIAITWREQELISRVMA
jgi:hypothetical protein